MARRKTGDKKVEGKKNRAASEEVNNVQAEQYSIAFEELHIGGNVGGDIRIGHTIGYTADQVSVLLKEITTTLQPKPFDGRCPYKGLEVFEEEDAELFFGRERLVNELVGRVKESRTLFITGPSGSGKSSLVRAGLIHALKKGAIKSSDRWLYETMKPGREPIKDLALAFSRLKSPELEDYFLAHTGEIDILNKCAESVLSSRKDQRFVLFIDQFEEVFTQISGEEERVAFINMLAHAGAVENGRVIVLFAMRSDFVSNCATYPALNELLSQEFRQIGAMQPEELVSAIALPARYVGLPIEDELIARIINDMKGEPGALPLMQFALKDLFDSQQEKGGLIALTLKDYLRHGGIHKSLERHADATFAELNQNEQELTRSIFSGLIEIGRGTQDTKRTALFDELIPANTKAEDVLLIVQKLADARLIITDEQAGKDTVTIAHEKLIDAWPWLKKLVNENRDVIALKNEIANDSKEWDKHVQDESYLYTGARLANVREQLDARKLVLSGMAHEFIQVGIRAERGNRQQRERTRRRILIGLVSFSAIVLGLLIFALIQLNVSRAQKLGFQAQAAFAEQSYNSAALYAYQASQIHQNDAADLVLSKLYYENFAIATLLRGNVSVVYSVASSADGRLASATQDGTIILWDLTTGQPAQTLRGHTHSIYSLAWSADGRLASASSDGTILWDLTTSQPAQILEGNGFVFTDVAWSTDGRLASAFYDSTISYSYNGIIILWDLTTSQPAQTLKGHTDSIISVAWSADGRLASVSRDGMIILWDLTTSQPAQILEDNGSVFTDVAWSADGRLASATQDGTIILWDLTTAQPAQTLRGHTDSVIKVAWSADGRLASTSRDGTIVLWNLTSDQPAQTLKGHADSVISVAWLADGRLASVSPDDTVILWDLTTSQPAQTLKGHTASVDSVAWSADGRLASVSEGGTIILWDLTTAQPAQILDGDVYAFTEVAWSADGRLASVSRDGIILWDLTTAQPAQILEDNGFVSTDVAWSADGRLASATQGGIIILWDLTTTQPAQTLRGHTDIDSFWLTEFPHVPHVAWSADGRLTSGIQDGTIILWDLTTAQPAQTLLEHTSSVNSVVWSADGRLVSASSDGTIILWDLTTAQPAQTLLGHTSSVNSVAWSADGRLASASSDGTIILWDLTTAQPAQTLLEHTSSVNSVAWSADGRLVSASSDGTIKIARGDLLKMNPCDWIYRNLTVEEWLAYQGAFYVYKPACSNLPSPILNPTPYDVLNSIIDYISNGSITDLKLILLSLRGRGILLGIVSLLIAILTSILWKLRKLI